MGKDVTLTVHPGTGHAFMAPHNALGHPRRGARRGDLAGHGRVPARATRLNDSGCAGAAAQRTITVFASRSASASGASSHCTIALVTSSGRKPARADQIEHVRDRGARVHPPGAEHDATGVHLEERERASRPRSRSRSTCTCPRARSTAARSQARHLAAVVDGDRVPPEPAAVDRPLDGVGAEPLGHGQTAVIRVDVVDLLARERDGHGNRVERDVTRAADDEHGRARPLRSSAGATARQPSGTLSDTLATDAGSKPGGQRRRASRRRTARARSRSTRHPTRARDRRHPERRARPRGRATRGEARAGTARTRRSSPGTARSRDRPAARS